MTSDDPDSIPLKPAGGRSGERGRVRGQAGTTAAGSRRSGADPDDRDASLRGPARRHAAPSPSAARPREPWRWAAFALYLALVAVAVLHHEPWRDEADTWLVARDASIGELLRFGNYVGSPLLWYLLQTPLAKLGAPYASLGFLNAACAAAAVALLLWRAPLPGPIRVGFAFSFFALYEYAAIARSYALGMALLFAVAALDARRLERPLRYGAALALLANTSLHALIVATPILAAFAGQARRGGGAPAGRRGAGVALGAAGWALAVLQLVPPPGGQLPGLAAAIEPGVVLRSLAGAFFPTAQDHPAARLLAGAIAAAAVVALARRPRALVVLLGAWLGLWALFVLKYPGELRHWGFLLLALLAAWWMSRADAARDSSAGADSTLSRGARRALAGGAALSIAWSVGAGAEAWLRDLRDPYSGSRALALWLEETTLTRLPIAAWPAPQAESILPYLPGVRFYDPGTGEMGSYMPWTQRAREGWDLPEAEVLRRVDRAFEADSVVLIVNRPLVAAPAAGFQAIHVEAGRAIMGDEQYVVYLRPGPRGAGRSPAAR